MKRLSAFLAVMMLSAFPTYGGMVTVDSPRDGFLALRSEPSAQTGVRLARIPHATALTLGECQTTADRSIWCRTSYQGKAGWIAKRYVMPQDKTASKKEAGGGTWRMGPEGFGPITFGMAQSEVEKLLGRRLGHNDSWSDDCFFTQVDVPGGAASIQVKDHRVVVVATDQYDRSSSSGSRIATSRGIRVGDALAQVDEAYRGLEGFKKEVDRGIEGDYPAVVYWDTRSKRGILFEYDQETGLVMGIRAGTRSIYNRHEGCG